MVRIHPDPPRFSRGGLAQLGEHLLCKQGVNGSIPLVSTINHPSKGIRRVSLDGMLSPGLFKNLEEAKKAFMSNRIGLMRADATKVANGTGCDCIHDDSSSSLNGKSREQHVTKR